MRLSRGSLSKRPVLALNTPHPEFGTLESQLQAIVAILQCRLIVPSFGEQSGEYERTR